MVTHRIRISDPKQFDAEVLAWPKQASCESGLSSFRSELLDSYGSHSSDDGNLSIHNCEDQLPDPFIVAILLSDFLKLF